MTGSVGSIIESIRFERECIPCNWPAERRRLGLTTTVTQRALDEIGVITGCSDAAQHERERYTIRWRDTDGGESSTWTENCWHPICDDSPWIFLMEEAEGTVRPRVLVDEWIRPNLRAAYLPGGGRNAVAVAYVLLLRTWRKDHIHHEIVARIGIPDQWEDPQYGNNRDELFSRRYYAHEGPGVYPADFSEAKKLDMSV